MKTKKIDTNTHIYGENTALRAVKVTSKNYRSVAKWCKGEAACKLNKDGKEIYQKIIMPGSNKNGVAQVGQWVIKDLNTKEVYRVADWYFQEHYVIVG